MSWHTDPQEPDYLVTNHTESLDLKNLVNADSYTPLYALLEAKTKGASKSESTLWLQGLLNDFDLYVTRELHRVHYQPWGRDWEIRAEYERQYKQKPNPEWNLRAIAARLMSFKEIKQYVKDESFWTRPKERPVYSLDCLSGGIINEQTRPWKYVTGIHPTDKKRGYVLTFEKPWLGKHADPVHHWGVYMDKSLTTRYFMACCGELVGQSEGCWIMLPEAKTKGAIEGVIQPYVLFPTVFNNVWENYVTGKGFPTENQIKGDYIIGTAFRDITKYANLHAQIQSSWAVASAIISASYTAYAKVIQDHLDANDSDAGRETNPFENPTVLTPQGRTAIETPIQLVLRYNEIQCMGALVPPLIRDYVNEKIFRVADMLASFTYERMGGIEYTKTDGSKGRIKMLKTDIDDTAQIDTMIKQIDESTDKPELKIVIKPALQALKTKITERMAENARRVRLSNTYETLKEIRQANMGQVTPVTGLDFSAAVAALKLFETNDQILLAREKDINDSLRSFRALGGFTAPPTVTLPVYPPLAGFTDTLLDQLETNINTAKLLYEVNQTSFSPVEPLSTNTNPTYKKALTFYKSVKDILDKPDYLTPTLYKRINLGVFIQEQANFAKATKDTDAELVQISNNLAVAAAKILYVQNKTGINQAVKDAVITKLDILSVIPTQARINALDTAKESEAAKSQKIIDDAATQYEAAEKPKREAAVKALQQVKNTFKAPQNVKSPDDVKAEIAKIMAAVKALEPSDEYSQDYLSFNKRLETLQNSLPASNDVFQPRDDLGLKTVDEVKAAYVAKWKESNGLLGAAKNLADALVNLVNSLSATNQDARAKDVEQLLTSIEKNAEQALAFAETEPQRIARLAREQAAREEAERKKREEAERQRREQEARDRKFNELNDIITKARAVAQQNYTDAIYVKLIPLVKEANILYGALDTKNALKYKEVAEQLQIDGKRTEALISEKIDTMGDVIMQEDRLYVEYLMLDSDRRVAFVEAYALFILQIFNAKTDEIMNIKSFATIADIPKDQTIPLSLTSYRLKQPLPVKQVAIPTTKDLITSTHFDWRGDDGGTCPYDAIFTALFKVPGLWLENTIFNATDVSVKTDACLKRIIDGMPLPEWIHHRICKQIHFLQDPLATEQGESCVTKRTWKECISVDESKALFKSLDDGRTLMGDVIQHFYNQGSKYTGAYLTKETVTFPHNDTLYNSKELICVVLFKTEDLVRRESGQIQYDIPLYLNNKQFTLISCVSFQPGHWVSYVRDPRSTEWWFFNAVPGGANVARKIGIRGDNVPIEVTKGSANEQPCGWYYMRVPDNVLKSAPAPAPIITITPTVVWTPSVDSFEKKNLDEANKWITNARTAYDGSTNAEKRAWATNLKLLQPDGSFIASFVVDEPVKGAFVIPSALWNDDTRRKALGYAYQKFIEWLQPMAFLNSDSLQADMRKALVAAQITEKPAPFFISGMNILQIDYVPSDVAKRDRLKQDLLEKTRTQTRSKDYWQQRLRVFLVQNQINVQDLRK